MSSNNNPQATPQPPAEETAAPVAPAPAASASAAPASAPEGNPPVVDGIIRLRDASGALHDYSIDSFDTASAEDVFSLLPTNWQSRIEAQAAFFENYQRTISDIPEELRAPGALERLFNTMREQGGYLSEETSPAVRAFLDGPNAAGLRNSGLFKGYQTADAIGNLIAGGANIVTSLPGQYIDALALPVRGLIYAGGAISNELNALPVLSREQALTMATAYQGMMYMATESEFAPRETRTEAPGAVGTAVGGIQSAFNYVAVGGIAVWNLVKGWFTGERVNWDQAWADAENYWTEGKGLRSASEIAQTNAVASSLDEVRPAVEARLRQTTINGVNMAPYLGVENGSLIVGQDGTVSTFNGQDAAPTPIMGPDGTTPLQAGQIEQTNLQGVPGSLGQDRSISGLTTTGLAVGGAALTYRGAAQGFARTMVIGNRPGIERTLRSTNSTLNAAQARLDAFDDGTRTTNWRGRPLDRAALQNAVDLAEDARNTAANRLAALPADPIADAQNSSSRITRTLGNLADDANHTLPADASRWQRAVSRVTSFGRPLGAGLAHTFNAGSGAVTGTVNGVASAITPNTPSPGGFFGSFGRWASRGLNAFAPLYTANQTLTNFNEGDVAGTAIHGTQTAAIAGTMARIGFSRATPIVGGLVSGGEFVNAAAHGDRNGMVSSGIDLGLIGGGAAIGAAAGAIGGPLAPATVPAGAAIGATVGGLAVAGRAIYNIFWGESPAPQTAASAPAPRATPAPQVAAVVNAPQPGLSNDETVAALMAQNQLLMQQLQMATGRAGNGQVAFNANAFSGLQTGAGSALVQNNGGQRPQVIRLNV